MRLRTFAIGVALTASTLATSAFAQASAQAFVSNIGYTLLDLDPNDGITPALTWLDTASGTSGNLSKQLGMGKAGGPNYVSTGSYTTINPGFDNTSSGSVNSSNGALSIPGALQATGNIPSGGSFFNTAYHAGYFNLTPNTAVTFSAQFDSHVTATTPAYAPEPNGYFDWAYFQVSTGADITNLVEGYDWNFLCCRNLSGTRSSAGLHDATVDGSTALSRTYTNDTVSTSKFGVLVNVSVSGYTVTPPVPEPGTWALMLLGLGGLGGLHARRQRS
jgi:hypothetical protein